MKNIYSSSKASSLACLIAVACLLTCCSPDRETLSPTSEIMESDVPYLGRPGDSLPFNSSNEFDLAGKIHNELLTLYYEQSPLPSTAAEIASSVESIATSNNAFALLRPPSYLPLTTGQVTKMDGPHYGVSQIINDSGLSTPAKASLSDFVTTIEDYISANENYDTVYNYCVAYEATVTADPVLTAHDKEVILTTAAIARHSAHFRKKRPKKNTDPDWDWLTVNVIGSSEGAAYGTAEAITYGLAGGIVQNK